MPADQAVPEMRSVDALRRLARGFVLASAVAYVAQAVAIFGWDEAHVAIASAALPVGLAYVLPRIRTGDRARAEDLASWERCSALLFAPWLATVVLLWSFRWIPWPSSHVPPRGHAATADLVGAHVAAYALIVMAAGIAFFVAFLRAPALRHEGKLAFLATVILAVTAIGGFGVLAVLGLAVT